MGSLFNSKCCSTKLNDYSKYNQKETEKQPISCFFLYNHRLSDLFGKVISSKLSDSNSGKMCEVGFDERLYFGVGGLISLLIWNRNSKNPCSNHQLAAKLTFLMSNALYDPNLSNETLLEGKVKFPSA